MPVERLCEFLASVIAARGQDDGLLAAIALFVAGHHAGDHAVGILDQLLGSRVVHELHAFVFRGLQQRSHVSLAVHEVVLVGARQMDARLDKVGVHVGNRPVPIHHFVGDSQLLHEFDAGGRLLARIAHQIFVKLALAALQVVFGMLLRRVVGYPGKRLLLFRSGSLNDAGRVHRVAARHGRSFQHHDVRAATRRHDGGGQPRTSGADD